MDNILDFVRSAAGEMGVSESQAESATGGVLKALESGASGSDFQSLLGALPGASDLLSKVGSGGGGESGGGLGGLLGAAASLTGGGGGGLGAAAGALSMLQGSGISSDKLGGFVSMFLKFAQSKAGKELIGRLLDGAPALKALIG